MIAATPDPSLPRLLGRYALYEQIASGGMASVHIGRLLGPVGFTRTVAIKRMHPQFTGDPDFVSMFLDEARLAARIRHPNVVPVLDVVAMPGELFLVMDYVPGEPLSRLILAAASRGQRIPAHMVVTILVGVLHGLHAAHEARSDRGEPLGIVHRDVSPHNVLVGTDGVARVLDFGIAKAADRIQTTRTGQLKGKLAYLAPEQVQGEASRRTDVYAASVVLWEALTGKRLFRSNNERLVIGQVLAGCSAPPSAHVPDLPRALDEVTMRGLSVDPAKRFPTARDMARALEAAIPMAMVSKIGDWVEVTAKATLDQRSARIASIERDSSLLQAPPQPPPAPPSRPPSSRGGLRAPSASMPADRSTAPLRRAVERTSVAVTDDMILTQLSVGSVSSSDRISLLGRPRRKGQLAAAVGGGLLVMGLLVAMVSQHSMGGLSSAASATPTGASPAVAPAQPVATADPSPSSTMLQSDPPAAAAADAGPGPAAARPPPTRRTGGGGPGQAASPPAKPAYNPLEHL